MKRITVYKPTAVTASLATPHFKPRRIVSEINFHLKIAALACMAVGSVTAQAFEPVVQLSSLDGSTGFRLDGVSSGDSSGISVSAAGDVNGDGIDDLLIGANSADPHDSASGSTYVVFGRSSPEVFGSTIGLSSLNGITGFRLDGVSGGDQSGYSVSAAGDVNGDDIDDLLIGAKNADHNGNGSGTTYVVFGRSSTFGSAIDLSSLDGSTGFRLDGENIGERSGISVSAAGDVNGDGIDDLLIGAYQAAPNAVGSGSTYVVFGRSSSEVFASVINLSSLNGSTGFRLDGVTTNDFSGRSVSAAGDVNGDSIDDLLIGASFADPNGNSGAGSTYVVFGRSSSEVFASTIDLSSLNGSTGFRLDGDGGFSGTSVSAAGDINDDTIDDLLISAPTANPNGNYSGSTYVVFGRSLEFSSTIDLSTLNGSTGFRLDGVAEQGLRSGGSVSAAGDVNGDGIDDLLIGAIQPQPSDDSLAGSTYVVFGSSSPFAAAIGLSSLNGSTGFRLDGVAGGDEAGTSVSAAGDVNRDGFDDLLIGARKADPNGGSSGSTYVVFGSDRITDTSLCVPVKTQAGGVAVICL